MPYISFKHRLQLCSLFKGLGWKEREDRGKAGRRQGEDERRRGGGGGGSGGDT